MRRDVSLALLVLWACLLVLAAFVHPRTAQNRAAGLPFVTAPGPGIDYYQFWMVGQARGRIALANVYGDDERGGMAELGRTMVQAAPQGSPRLAASVQARPRLETFSTPFLYAVIGALATGDYDRDFDRYLDVCLACLVLSIVALGTLLHYSAVDCLLFVSVAALWSEPLSSDLRVGNVNQLQLGGLTLYLLTRSGPDRLWKDVAGGLALGLLVAFKPTLALVPALLTLAWIADRRFRTVLVQGAASVAAAGVAYLTGCRFLGSPGAWIDWWEALPHLESVSNVSVGYGNFSLARVILEYAGSDVALLLLAGVMALAGLVLFRTRLSRGAPSAPPVADHLRFERDFAVVGLACAFSVVALRLVWLHYYVLLTPLLLFVFRAPSDPGRQPWAMLERAGAWLSLLASLGRPVVALLATSRFAVPTYVAGAWILTLLGLWHVSRSGREGNGVSPPETPPVADPLLAAP